MRNALLYQVLLIIVFLSVVNGCIEVEEFSQVTPNSPRNYFFLLNADFKVIQKLDVDLLKSVNNDLKNRNKNNEYLRLNKTYDIETGNLRKEAFQYIQQVESKTKSKYKTNSVQGAKSSQVTITFNYYLQNIGWHYNWPVYSNGSENYYGLSQWESNCDGRLESFNFSVYPNFSSQWGDSYSFCYNAHSGSNWVGPRAAGQWAGNIGEPMRAFWIWVGQQVAYNVYYRAWFCQNTHSDWISNGATCGNPNSGTTVMGIQFTIMYYSD